MHSWWITTASSAIARRLSKSSVLGSGTRNINIVVTSIDFVTLLLAIREGKPEQRVRLALGSSPYIKSPINRNSYRPEGTGSFTRISRRKRESRFVPGVRNVPGRTFPGRVSFCRGRGTRGLHFDRRSGPNPCQRVRIG